MQKGVLGVILFCINSIFGRILNNILDLFYFGSCKPNKIQLLVVYFVSFQIQTTSRKEQNEMMIINSKNEQKN